MTKDNTLTAADVLRKALEADKRIRGYVRETPAEHACFLSHPGKCSVYLKLENTQLTGSFKLRGAFNRLLQLTDEEKERGIITASTGNHGIAVTYALRKLGLKGKIIVPENISRAKLDILNMYKADLAFYGDDTGITEAFARQKARDNGQLYISPYNDPEIIGGQGTIGVELRRQLDKIDAVFIPVGGGGLAAGIAGYLKSVDRHIEVIGCQPEQSPVMVESIKAGQIVDMESGPTLADGTAGRIEAGALTFTLCRDWLDEFVLVSEEEIEKAIRLVIRRFNMMVEGAAALSLASFLKIKERYRGKNVVLVLSGSRIHYETLQKIIC
jgi:threonine dehydratase